MKKILFAVLLTCLAVSGIAQTLQETFNRALAPCQYYDAERAEASQKLPAGVQFDTETVRKYLKLFRNVHPTKEQFSCVAYYTSLHNEDARKVLGYLVQIGKINADTRDALGRTPFEVLLKNTKHYSANLHWTLETAWYLYDLGSRDVNATDRFGNTVLHLTVNSTPEQWLTQLARWVEIGVKDVPNKYDDTALNLVEQRITNIDEDIRLDEGISKRKLRSEYKKARKVLKNTPAEKQRQEEERKAARALFLQTLQNVAQTDK